jgi:lysophospholipase L1-like esterase
MKHFRVPTLMLTFMTAILVAVSGAPASATSTAYGNGSGRYAALGDSVAAGMGLPASPTAFDVRCKQSVQGYPHGVAAKLNMSLTNVACSGATAGDIVTKQRVDGPNVPAQIATAFAGGVPELITITAGANDVKWNEFIYACYQDDCTKSRYDVAARSLLGVYKAKLAYALNRIEKRSGAVPPAVIMTGYYNPVSRACTSQTNQLTAAEIQWLDKQGKALNKIIQKEASQHDFARYVPINFSGHDICSKNAWVQGLDAPAPLHPTAAGQEYITKRVTATAKRLLQ